VLGISNIIPRYYYGDLVSHFVREVVEYPMKFRKPFNEPTRFLNYLLVRRGNVTGLRCNDPIHKDCDYEDGRYIKWEKIRLSFPKDSHTNKSHIQIVFNL
jgi:hypothetical protein